MTEILLSLFATIQDRKSNPVSGSYTTSLFEKGVDEIGKKVGEEGVEVVVAALSQSDERLISELADLAYHALVLMAQRGITLEQVAAELEMRHR